MIGFVSVENNVRKGENAGDQHFLLFPTLFFKAFSFKTVYTQDCLVTSET